MTTPTSNPNRKWGLEFVDATLAATNAMRMGPGPYLAVPLAFFTSGDERTHYALALWVPELSGVEDGSLAQSELDQLLDRWGNDGRRAMILPLYVGLPGFEYLEEDQRPYQRRVATNNEGDIWIALQSLITHLASSKTPAGRSWRATVKYGSVHTVGYWQ